MASSPEIPTAEFEGGAQPLSPAARQRLQKLFEHATRTAEKNDYDYAHDMFSQCVSGDPTNILFLQNFLANLQRKYGKNKKGSKMAGMKTSSAKKALKSAMGKEDHKGAVKAACDVLKFSPWDAGTLMQMAEACWRLDGEECQLFCLKWALNADQKNVNVNRQAAEALTRMGQFDQAIACWHRVEEAKPGNEEAAKAISTLTVEKTIHHGGYDRELITGQSSGKLPKTRPAAKKRSASDSKTAASEASDDSADADAQQPPEATREEVLQQAIQSHPEEVNNYVQLADLYAGHKDFSKAYAVLKKALEVSGGADLSVRQRMEDIELHHGRHQLAIAQKRANAESSDDAQQLVHRMRAEINQKEIEIYAARSDREPGNTALKYELGRRLKSAKKYEQAIQALQGAVGDSRKKGNVLLELGECFQYIEKYKLAMANYEKAIDALGDSQLEEQKLALYRAGVLATGLKDLDRAEKWLNDLAAVDYGYRDVPARLDKIERLRNKE